MTNNDLSTQDHDGTQASFKIYGMRRQKKHLNRTDLLAVIVVLVCLGASVITISPRLMVAWSLGVKRQLQIIGLLISIMNLCLNVIAPKVFLMSEARYGQSHIQNYDAILRSSILLSHTGLLWRVVLLIMIVLPNGLSVAYKEFIQGSHSYTLKDTGGYYGLAAPGQLAKAAGEVGVALMVNGTLSFVEASANDNFPLELSFLPQAYGFNLLLLSENSAAFLDAPMPDYISSIQATLVEGESQSVSASVRATISTYNSTAEDFRNDPSWWNQYFEFEPGLSIAEVDLYIGKSIGLLIPDTTSGDSSWCFIGIVPSGPDDPTINVTFQYTALEFNTRRDLCQGTWIVTRSSVELTSGHCNQSSLSDVDQVIVTGSSLSFTEYYMPTLADFLATFANERSTSSWLLPRFTTAVAGMYWSRITILRGYNTADHLGTPSDPTIYYYVADSIVSTRITMDPSWVLYLVLAIQPLLTVLFFITALTFSHTPLDSGFGITAILAGVREESLKRLQGASMSGRLSEPVRMQIAVSQPVGPDERGKMTPEIEYVIGGTGSNGVLGHAPRHRILGARNWIGGFWGRMTGRERNQYEMFSAQSERLRDE